MSRTIKVTIPQMGAPKVEAVGFDGEGCAAATKSIENALNSSGQSTTEFKPEWANPESAEEAEQETLSW